MSIESPVNRGAVHGGGHHHRVHRRIFWTLVGIAMAAPLLFVSWFDFRIAACWSPGAAPAFVSWMCPNLGPLFGLVFLSMIVGLLSVASAVVRAGETTRRNWFALGEHRKHYRTGLEKLELSTQRLVGGLSIAVPALAAFFVLVVLVAPRVLG